MFSNDNILVQVIQAYTNIKTMDTRTNLLHSFYNFFFPLSFTFRRTIQVDNNSSNRNKKKYEVLNTKFVKKRKNSIY